MTNPGRRNNANNRDIHINGAFVKEYRFSTSSRSSNGDIVMANYLVRKITENANIIGNAIKKKRFFSSRQDLVICLRNFNSSAWKGPTPVLHRSTATVFWWKSCKLRRTSSWKISQFFKWNTLFSPLMDMTIIVVIWQHCECWKVTTRKIFFGNSILVAFFSEI